MEKPEEKHLVPWRVLIASNHSLFGKGLRSLLREHWQDDVNVVGLVTNIDEAMDALENLNPNLVIVDYDDEALNRDAFLARFVETKQQLRVVLLSLKEGQEGAEATLYDRRTLKAARIEDWFRQGEPGQADPEERGENS
jgi:chemotaxis response regulator CheB